jgi:ribonuclease P protein component
VSTIKSSREIDVMFRSARRVAHPLVIALAAKAPSQRGQNGRVAYIAGKKLGGAVMRNRCRRVLRESARRCGAPWDAWDVALVARPGTAGAGPGALDEAVRGVLTRAGVL